MACAGILSSDILQQLVITFFSMYIKSAKKGIIEIDADNAVAAIVAQGFKPEDVADHTVVLGQVQGEKVISFPGEYEYGDLSIVALESTDVRDGVADLFRITADRVDVLYMSTVPAVIEKDEFELMGAIDVVLLGADALNEATVPFIKKIDPYVVIVAGTKDKEEVQKILGMEVSQEEKKFKMTDKDFAGEDQPTLLYLLTA